MPSPKELAKALAYRGEIRNTPQNSFLGGVANFLAPVSEFLDRDKISDRIPFLGGLSAADLTGVKGTESLVRDMSYGKAPIRGATLNTVKVDPRLVDVAGLGGAMFPIAKNLSKAALRNVAEQVQNRTGFARLMPDTRMGIVPDGKAMSVPAKSMNDGSQDLITYIGRKGQKFQITKQRDNELLDIHSSIADKAREIFGDGVEIFDSGMSSSRYVRLPNGSKIRVSDHPLPSDFAAIHGVPDIEVRGGQDLQKAIDYMTDVKSNNTMPNSQKRYDDLSLREELRSNGVPLFSVDARQIKKLVSSGVGYDDIASQLQQKYPKLTDADAAKIYTVIGRGKFDKFDVPVKDQIVRYGDDVGGAMMQRPKTEFEILHDTAQRNAALPVEQGGLGLPANNTYIDRANVMYPTDAYHGGNSLIKEADYKYSGKGNDQYGSAALHTGSDPSIANSYVKQGESGGNIMPLRINREGHVEHDKAGNLTSSQIKKLIQSSPDEYALSNFGDVEYEGANKVLGNAVNSYKDVGDGELLTQMNMINNDFYTGHPQKFNEKISELTGIKGLNVDVGGGNQLYLSYKPENIRSRFAAFDPFRRHEADILAGVGVGGMLDPQAIAEALRQQDRK